MDLLIHKFKYNTNDSDPKRQQALRNAYILFGFDALRSKLRSLDTTEEIKVKDIQFLNDEERRIT